MAASSGNMEILTPGGKRLGAFRSFFITLLVVIAIVMVTIFFAVRTEGGREFVAHRLGRCAGTEVIVEGARIGWPYALIVEGPSTEGFDELTPGFKAQSLRIALGLDRRLRIDVLRGELHLVQNKRGEWMPSFFGRLGDLPAKNAGHLERLTSTFRDRVSLEIRDSVIRWIDSEGNETASVTGLDLVVLPVEVPGRRMSYCRISSHSLVTGDRKAMDVEREWLMSETEPCLGLSGAGRHDKAQAGSWFSIGEYDDSEEAGKRTD